MKGLIHWGINNIFCVWSEGSAYECRLKGKVLKGAEDVYNPLSPGDEVEWEPDAHSPGKGMILGRIDRRNSYSRWNKKRRCPQTLAANLDRLVLVSALSSPPFRPRFLDRALLMAEKEGLSPLILVNKCDQGLTEDQEDRLAVYQELGWDVHLCSVVTGEGIDELKEHLEDSVCALVGQSGVGKSSLLNVLHPQARQRVGELSSKHNRGNHTTNFSLLLPWPSGQGGIIDTPGVRELEVFGIESGQLSFYYPEFQPYLGQCSFSGCTHLQEPGCAVLKALEEDQIHPDRWESYKKLFLEIQEGEKSWT